ncbi:MAG: phosphomannomutase/phosphoglucomutase, partial [Candidatus Diapherotrites archaeon]|nr:phosphomannomutase/phosphoglucomutase [Candidatus Diapherotrites archaeon]
KKDVLSGYIKNCLSFINAKKIRPLRVVVDASNGMAGLTVPAVEKKLPLRITKMFFELDGGFPNHEPNPLKPENIVALQKRVLAEKADFGVIFDGDGDRMFMVDEKGGVVGGSQLTCLIAANFLRKNKGARIVYTSVMSKAVPETIRANGGIPVVERVGHSFIKQRMRKENALFGGELSGHFYFRENFFADSALIAVLVALEMVSDSGKNLSELVAPYKRYFAIDETNADVKDKDGKIREIGAVYAPKAKKVSRLDGFSAYFDGWWFNVRPSGTENLLRLNLEADTRELMEEKKEELLRIIRS